MAAGAHDGDVVSISHDFHPCFAPAFHACVDGVSSSSPSRVFHVGFGGCVTLNGRVSSNGGSAPMDDGCVAASIFRRVLRVTVEERMKWGRFGRGTNINEGLWGLYGTYPSMTKPCLEGVVRNQVDIFSRAVFPTASQLWITFSKLPACRLQLADMTRY